MTYFELTSVEKEFHAKLTEDERKLYTLDQEQLAVIETCNDSTVRWFVEAARLLNELHRLHGRYNEQIESAYNTGLTKERIQLEEQIAEELFSMPISIGNFSSVFSLASMDEYDALYSYLTKVKMNRFNVLSDEVDIAMLIDLLVKNGRY